MSVTEQKGGAETNLPNDVYREKYSDIKWGAERAKPTCCCRLCGHDMDKCTCGVK